ncbi:MAG: hypothetical protein Q9223_001379 [Gallowayella weberi]
MAAPRWPPCPYAIHLSRRPKSQFLLVTVNDRADYGDRAKELAVQVCSQMIAWLLHLPQRSHISKGHQEKKSFGESPFAEEFSIFIDLIPRYAPGDSGEHSLDRELAYFAFEQLKEEIALFGALHGAMELYSFGFQRGTIIISVFHWPPNVKAGGKTS